MAKIEYPKWLYHATEPPRIVAGPDEQAALGAEWAETPAAFAAAGETEEDGPADAPAAPPPSRKRERAKR